MNQDDELSDNEKELSDDDISDDERVADSEK